MARTTPDSRHTADLCSAAYDALLARIEAVGAEALLPAPADLRAVVRTALEAADLADDDALRPRLAALPAEEFDPANLETLREAARAMRHMLARRDAAEDQGSGVLLDEAFATLAHDTRARMLKVALHYFEDDAEHAAELKRVARKKGHGQLRDDLERLASFYEAHRDVIERDPKYFRADDVGAARRIAAELTELLKAAQSDELGQWDARLAQAFTLLAPAHEEVRAAGQYLLRRGGAERFAALPGVRRRARKE
jgi:predicted kinase